MYGILHIQLIVCCHHLKQRNDRTILEGMYVPNCFLCMIKLRINHPPPPPKNKNQKKKPRIYKYYIYMQVLLD